MRKIIKRPKKIVIGGKEWRISYDSKKSGGSFQTSDYTIKIGTKYKQDIIEVFLHEVIEAALSNRMFRWPMWDNTNNRMIFVFDHNQFEEIIKDLAYALKPILSIE